MKILIAIPTLNGTVTGEVAEWLFRAGRYRELEDGISFTSYILGGIQPRWYARNRLMKEFFASEADFLWWIDADMAPSSSIVHLVNALKDEANRTQYDIFTCYTLCLKNDDPDLPIPLIPPVFRKELSNGQMEVQVELVTSELIACGFGCTILSRKVLEDRSLWAAQDKFGFASHDPEGIPGVFADVLDVSGRCKQSEDTHFTHRASRKGYKILYVPQAEIGHYKTLNLFDPMRWGNNCFVEGLKRGGSVEVLRENS